MANDQKITLHIDGDISDVRKKLEQLRTEISRTTGSNSSTINFGKSLVNNPNPTKTGFSDSSQFNSSIKQLSEIINTLPDKLSHLNDEAHQIKNGGTNNTYAQANRAQVESKRAVYSQWQGKAKDTLRSFGYDSNGNYVDSRQDFRHERNQANTTFQGIHRQVNRVAHSNASNSRTIQNAQTNQNISYERYHRIQQDYTNNDAATRRLRTTIGSQMSNYGMLADSYSAKASMAGSLGNSSDQASYQKQYEYYKNLEDKLQALTDTLDKTNQTAKQDQETITNGVNSGNISESYQRGSIGSMLQSRSFAIGMNFANNTQNAISSSYQSGSQARLGMQDSINSITLGNVGNGGNSKYRADNSLSSSLAHTGLNNGTGYSTTDMAAFAGDYAQSSGNVNAGQDVSAANYASQLARFSGVGTQATNQLVSSLGLSGAISNSGDLGTITRQFQGMLANTGTTGQSIQQAQGLSSLISNQYANGNRVTTNDASRLVALQGTMSHYGFSGQQGAQMINNVGNSISSQGFSNPAMRFAWMQSDTSRYAGTIGQAQEDLDMSNPLSSKNAGHLSGMIQNLKQTMGHGNDTLTAQYLMNNLGISGEEAKALTRASDNGSLSPSRLRSLENKYKSSGRSANKREKRQFSAQGNSTLDIQVAIKQNGDISTSSSMDSIRGAKNGATKGLPGVVNSALSVGGNMLGTGIQTVAAVGASKMLGRGLQLVGGRFGGRTGKLFSGLGSFIGGDTATRDTERAATDSSEAVRASSKSGFFSRIFNRSKSATRKGSSKLSDLVKTGGKDAESSLGDGKFLDDTDKLAKFGGKGNIALQAALSLPEYYSDMKSKHPVKNTVKTTGGLAGGLSGAAAGAAAGAAIPVLGETGIGEAGGAIIGGIAGSGLGRWAAGGLTNLFSSKSAKASKRNKSTSNSSDSNGNDIYQHAEKVIKDANEWLHNFNVSLDEAQRIIRQANNKTTDKNSSSGSGSKSSTSSSGSSSSANLPNGSKSKSTTSWTSNINAVAKAMGVKLKKGDAGLVEESIGIESSGNPRAKNGQYEGLLQYSPSTFEKYAVKGHKNRNNGNDDLYALFNDSNWRKDLDDRTKGSWGPSGSVRKHANGGIFDQEQTGTIADAGPEAVVPLSFNKRSQATSIMNTITGYMGMNLSKAARSTGGSNSYTFNPQNTIPITVSGSDNKGLTTLKQQIYQVQQQLTMKQQREFYNKVADHYAN